MDTQLFDIDVKLPIIRATDDSSRSSSYDSIPIVNNNNPTNNIHNHHNHSNNNDCNNNNNTNERQLLDLPKPSYRIAQNYHYKRRTHTAKRFKSKELTQDSYFHYQEPTPEQLLDRVEYDMDDEDTEWLKIFNKDHGAKFGHQVGENEFEKIMDRLEKESYFESKKSGKEVLPDIDEDAVCSICNDGKCENANVILFCDMCDLAVHQECYGVPYIPEGQWLCRRCLQSPSRNVDCVLCPNKGGAFKQTDDNRWAHVICALWVPEVCFANTVFLEPIDSIDRIPAARWRLCCYICKQKKIGACIQCHKPNCYVPFHVTCAQQAGLYMKIKTCRYDTPEGEFKDVKKEAFCDAHGPSNGSHRAGMYSGDETDEEDLNTQAYKKWKKENRDKMKKTRKILAEKRESAFNPIAEPTINDEKLLEISKLLTLKGKKNLPESFIALRETFIRHIQGYWLLKRAKRNGVPLLRRLQVSYTNNSHVIGIGDLPKSSSQSIEDLDKEKYTRLRYDLEKARLLVGEVKKRELLKKRLFKYSMEIVENRYKIIDNEHPVLE